MFCRMNGVAAWMFDEVIMSVPEHLSIRRSHEDGVERLVPVGELDLATAPILERAFDLVFDDGDVRMIVVDLAELSFMDSSGLHLLLRMTEACRAGDRLRVVNSSPAVVRLLDVSGTRAPSPARLERRRIRSRRWRRSTLAR